MAKPTDEQVKKFWEWCVPDIRDWSGDNALIYDKPYWRVENLIPIDLNNLFKYAVEKVFEELSNRGESYKMQRLWLALEDSFLESNQYYGKSALALFWAIWEVIHG